MLCLTCRKISPSGSAYCAYCPGPCSFNAPLCAGGHRCPVDKSLQACPICGNSEFSEMTRGIPTGWLAKPVIALLLLGVWKISLAHLGGLMSVGGTVTAYTFGVVTNTNASTLEFIIRTSLFYAVLLWLLGLGLQLMPGSGGAIGKFLRGLPLFALRTLLRWLPRLLRFVVGGILRMAGFHAGKAVAPVAKAKARSVKGDDLR